MGGPAFIVWVVTQQVCVVFFCGEGSVNTTAQEKAQGCPLQIKIVKNKWEFCIAISAFCLPLLAVVPLRRWDGGVKMHAHEFKYDSSVMYYIFQNQWKSTTFLLKKTLGNNVHADVDTHRHGTKKSVQAVCLCMCISGGWGGYWLTDALEARGGPWLPWRQCGLKELWTYWVCRKLVPWDLWVDLRWLSERDLTGLSFTVMIAWRDILQKHYNFILFGFWSSVQAVARDEAQFPF